MGPSLLVAHWARGNSVPSMKFLSRTPQIFPVLSRFCKRVTKVYLTKHKTKRENTLYIWQHSAWFHKKQEFPSAHTRIVLLHLPQFQLPVFICPSLSHDEGVPCTLVHCDYSFYTLNVYPGPAKCHQTVVFKSPADCLCCALMMECCYRARP